MIGGRARLVFASPFGPGCSATAAVAEEISRYVPKLAAKRGLDAPLMFAALGVLPVIWEPETSYIGQKGEALKRIGERDATDWPTVALALTRGLPIWSQDRDMESSGLDVWTTGMLLDAIADRQRD